MVTCIKQTIHSITKCHNWGRVEDSRTSANATTQYIEKQLTRFKVSKKQTKSENKSKTLVFLNASPLSSSQDTMLNTLKTECCCLARNR